MGRLETGIVQDRDDWPGVFIRGDRAFSYANALRAALRQMPADDTVQSMVTRSTLEGLLALLAKSNVNDPSHVSAEVRKIEAQQEMRFARGELYADPRNAAGITHWCVKSSIGGGLFYRCRVRAAACAPEPK